MKFSQAHSSLWTRVLHGLLGLALMCVLTMGLAQLDSATRVTAVKLAPNKAPAPAAWTLAAEVEI